LLSIFNHSQNSPAGRAAEERLPHEVFLPPARADKNFFAHQNRWPAAAWDTAASTMKSTNHVKDRIGVNSAEGSNRSPEEEVAISNRVMLVPSQRLTPAQRRAVAKVSQDRSGNVRVEMHDKLAALDKLARALGMYQEPAHVEDHSKTDMRATIIYEGRADRPAPRQAPPKPVGGPRDIGD
jgi:hypothetical protein